LITSRKAWPLLHRFRDLPLKLDVERAVRRRGVLDLDLVGELEAALEGAAGDTAV
jgi:hypothetical protein